MGYWAAEVDLLPLSGSGRQLTLLNEKRGHEYMNPVGTLSKSSQVEENIAVRPQIPLNEDENRVLSCFKDATVLDWEDWRWQIRNRIRTKDVLQKIIELSPEEERDFHLHL